MIQKYVDKNGKTNIDLFSGIKQLRLNDDYRDVKDALKLYENGEKSIINFNEATKNCNKGLLEGIDYTTEHTKATKILTQNYSSATKSISGFKGVTSTLKNSLSSLATGMLNFGIAMAAEALISYVWGLYNDYINRFENRAEEVREKAEQWENELSTLESNEKSVKDIQDEYYSLADGVDSYGNNISLTSEQYERYIELSNQIANMYPELVASYDAQGNAILACKNNAEALTNVLKDSKEAYYNSIVANGSTTWDNAMKNIAADSGETYNNQLAAIEKVREAINKAKAEGKSLQITNSWNASNSSLLSDTSELILDFDLYDSFKQIAEDTGIKGDHWSLNPEYTIDSDNFNQVINTLTAQYKQLEKLRDEELSTAEIYFQAYLKTCDSFYNSLDDEGQQIADTLFNSLTWDNFYSDFSEDELKDFSKVQEKFDKALEGLFGEKGNKKKGIDAWNKVVEIQTKFTAGETSVDDLKAVYKDFENVLNELGIDAESKELICSIVFNKVKMDDDASVDGTISNIINRVIPNPIKTKTNGNTTIEESQTYIKNTSPIIQPSDVVDRKEFQEYLNTLDKETLNLVYNSEEDLSNMSLDTFKDFVSELQEEADKEVSFNVSVEDATSEFENLKSTLDTVKTVITDYNEQGYMSFENLKTLLSLDDSYLNMLMNEQGELELTADKYRDLAKAELERLKALYLQEALDSVNSLETEAQALNYLTAVQDENASSLNDLARAKWEDAYATARQKDLEQNTDVYTKAVEAGYSAWSKRVALMDEYASTMGDLANTDYVSEQAREIKALEDEQEALEDSKEALEDKKEALEKQKEALEDHKEALEKEQEALEDEKKSIEDAVDSIKDYVDLVEDMIKQNKELEKEGLQSQKEYYETQKQNIDDLIDARKEAIQEQKEEYEWNEKLKDQQNDYAKSALSAAVASLDDSSAGRKAYKEAQDNLDSSRSTLRSSLIEHDYDERTNALDKFKDEQDEHYDSLIEDVDNHIEEIDDYLSNEVQLYRDACSMIDNDHGQLYSQLHNYVLTYTTTTEAEFNYMWTQAQSALQQYNFDHLSLFDLMNQMQERIYILTEEILRYDSMIDAVDLSISNVDTSINIMSESIGVYSGRIDELKGKVDELNGSVSDTIANLNAVSEANSQAFGYKYSYNGRTYYSSKSQKEEAVLDILNQMTRADNSAKTLLKNKGWQGLSSMISSGISAYASGTRHSKGGVAIVDEHGKEAILDPIASGRYTILNEGSQVFTAEQTKKLYEFAKEPETFINPISSMQTVNRYIPITNQPTFNIKIAGDATQATVNALRKEFTKISKESNQDFMRTILQNKKMI